jgi:hypothetical protein
MTTDHYALSSPKALAEIEKRLAAESGVIPPDPDDPGPERDYAFTRAGNKMHKNWDNTIIGRAIVDTRGVRLETNSRERADALRGRFEALCGGLATHRAREHVDPMSKVKKVRREDRAGERFEERSPEAAAAVLAFKSEQYQTWLDQELPALDGKTPREAVKTPARRRQVEVILKEIEHREVREPEGARFDVGKLREELGLRP